MMSHKFYHINGCGTQNTGYWFIQLFLLGIEPFTLPVFWGLTAILCLFKVCILSTVLYSAHENSFDLASLDRFTDLQAKHGKETYTSCQKH